MQKPISMVINETREFLIKTINESNLPPFIMEMLLKEIYTEINKISTDIAIKEREQYLQNLQESTEM